MFDRHCEIMHTPMVTLGYKFIIYKTNNT